MNKQFTFGRINDVFTGMDCDYEDMKNLMVDAAMGNFSEGVTKKEAEDKIRSMTFEILGLTPEQLNNKKLFRRAMKNNVEALFEVYEDVVEDMLVQGWEADPFMMQFVEQRNLADGDRNDFWTDDDVILSVAEVSKSGNHDVHIQRLAEGSKYTVPTSRYAVAVGTDLRLYLAGRIDFSKLVNAIYRAFDEKIKDTVYTEVVTVGSKLPATSQLSIAVPFTSAAKDTTKTAVDELIELVSAANGGAPVVLMGTETALKKLDVLTKVDWSDSMKNELYRNGGLGFYEGTALSKIPQRVKRTGVKGSSEVLTKLIATDIILVMPQAENKFIKMVNVGDPEIVEITEAGQRNDDQISFEYQQSFGIAPVIGRYFGVIKITG